MSAHIIEIAIWTAPVLLITAAIVLIWPYRRERHWIQRRLIDAPREQIWDTYHPGSENPAHATFHRELISSEKVATYPEIWEQVVDNSGGHGTHVAAVRYETLNEQWPERSALCACEIGDQVFPYGTGHSETLELEEQPGGTLVSLGFHGETDSLWQYLYLRRHRHGYLQRLQRFCESGMVSTNTSRSRGTWISLTISALAIVSFCLLFGWVFALLLTGVLIVHEFGHWLAMRITGQPAPRVTLIPFLGGVAVANHPHKTLFDDAFCSLMGPGFSALPTLLLMIAAWVLGVPNSAPFLESVGEFRNTFDISVFPMGIQLAICAISIAVVTGGINLLQLVPVLPLDGGQVLRALLQSFSINWARWVLLALTGLGILGLVVIQYYLFAGILALGALQAWHMKNYATKTRPMSAAGATAICLGYGLTLGIHVGAIYYSFHVFIY